MSERRELDDILIDEEETPNKPNGEGGSRKGILLISAVIVIFAIGAIAFLQVTKEEKKPESNQVIKEAQKLDTSSDNNMSETPSKIEDTTSKAVISSDDKNIDDKFDQIVKEIKAKNEEDKKSGKAAPKVDLDEKMPIQKNVTGKKEDSKTKKAKEQMNANVAKQKVNKTPKVAHDAVATKEKKTEGIKAGFYIQVGSFSKFTPSRNFLNTIKQNSYSFYLQKIDRGNRKITKVLIGPFKTRGEATDAINVVRREIEPGAFLKIIK